MTFIYLHGFASSPASRKAQFFAGKLRERGVEVQVPHLEADGFRDLTVTGQLRAIEECARGQSVRLIGSSMGGYLAALYASLHPETERLVLLAPAFGFASRWRLRLGEEKFKEWRERGLIEMMHYGTGKPEAIGFGLIEDGMRYPAEPDFAQPALIFHGNGDEVVPVSFSEEFVRTRPNAQLTTMASGHELTEVMEEIWARSEEFLLSQ